MVLSTIARVREVGIDGFSLGLIGDWVIPGIRLDPSQDDPGLPRLGCVAEGCLRSLVECHGFFRAIAGVVTQVPELNECRRLPGNVAELHVDGERLPVCILCCLQPSCSRICHPDLMPAFGDRAWLTQPIEDLARVDGRVPAPLQLPDILRLLEAQPAQRLDRLDQRKRTRTVADVAARVVLGARGDE